MKRYLLFAGDDFYPSGGMGDFIADFDSLEKARAAEDEWYRKVVVPDSKWSQIYDQQEETEV